MHFLFRWALRDLILIKLRAMRAALSCLIVKLLTHIFDSRRLSNELIIDGNDFVALGDW